MKKEISQKQLKANRENGKRGGVKTDDGKAISKYNAVKHGILKEMVSEYEMSFYEDITERIDTQFQPVGILEKIIVDRIGVYYLKLYRVAKSENEYMKSILNPRIVSTKDLVQIMPLTETVIESKGYIPIIPHEAVEKLSDTYLRYEISIENRLYKAIYELQRLQSARNKKDINEEEQNGFVS